MEGFGLLQDGTTFRLSIVDISYDGCKVESSVALFPGLSLTMSVTGIAGAIDARVSWCREGRAGLRFDPDRAPEKSHQPRVSERAEVEAEVSLRRSGGHSYRVRLFDLTGAGCKIEFVERPKGGELVWVKFDGIEAIEATVCWVDGHTGGLRFLRPFYPSVFELLLARLQAPA